MPPVEECWRTGQAGALLLLLLLFLSGSTSSATGFTRWFRTLATKFMFVDSGDATSPRASGNPGQPSITTTEQTRTTRVNRSGDDSGSTQLSPPVSDCRTVASGGCAWPPDPERRGVPLTWLSPASSWRTDTLVTSRRGRQGNHKGNQATQQLTLLPVWKHPNISVSRPVIQPLWTQEDIRGGSNSTCFLSSCCPKFPC